MESRGQRRAAVLGAPITHSLSPTLHRAAYRAAGLAWHYEAIEMQPGGLAAFLGSLDDSWAGLSLTMPLKETVIPLVDTLSPTARLTEAVNTVVLPGSPAAQTPGSSGHNTDVGGIVAAFTGAGVKQAGAAVVLGTGATARSAAAALGRLGAGVVTVVGRRREPAERVMAVARDSGVPVVDFVDWAADPAVGSCLRSADVTISTVPAGAADPVSGPATGSQGALLDVVYSPWPTPLAQVWSGTVIPGLAMLVHQAAAQVRLMSGIEPDLGAMMAAVGLTSQG